MWRRLLEKFFCMSPVVRTFSQSCHIHVVPFPASMLIRSSSITAFMTPHCTLTRATRAASHQPLPVGVGKNSLSPTWRDCWMEWRHDQKVLAIFYLKYLSFESKRSRFEKSRWNHGKVKVCPLLYQTSCETLPSWALHEVCTRLSYHICCHISCDVLHKFASPAT